MIGTLNVREDEGVIDMCDAHAIHRPVASSYIAPSQRTHCLCMRKVKVRHSQPARLGERLATFLDNNLKKKTFMRQVLCRGTCGVNVYVVRDATTQMIE